VLKKRPKIGSVFPLCASKLFKFVSRFDFSM
jgi:hypothetical protein